MNTDLYHLNHLCWLYHVQLISVNSIAFLQHGSGFLKSLQRTLGETGAALIYHLNPFITTYLYIDCSIGELTPPQIKQPIGQGHLWLTSVWINHQNPRGLCQLYPIIPLIAPGLLVQSPFWSGETPLFMVKFTCFIIFVGQVALCNAWIPVRSHHPVIDGNVIKAP